MEDELRRRGGGYIRARPLNSKAADKKQLTFPVRHLMMVARWLYLRDTGLLNDGCNR
jgi:hypothetical protein